MAIPLQRAVTSSQSGGVNDHSSQHSAQTAHYRRSQEVVVEDDETHSEVREESHRSEETLEVIFTKHELQRQREVLDRLRLWHNWEQERQRSLKAFLLSKIYPKRPPCPSGRELLSLAKYYFPQRASLKATVCDFGHEKFHMQEVGLRSLGNGKYRADSCLGL